MRNQDPTYDQFYQDGPSLDDKWRSTYPYVPTSYLHQTQGEYRFCFSFGKIDKYFNPENYLGIR